MTLRKLSESGHEAEIADGWKHEVQRLSDTYNLKFVAYSCLGPSSLSALFDVLDRLGTGVFDAVFIIPFASTWSRARHASSADRLVH